MDKLNICFDGRILYNGYNNSGRTGIYFVLKNTLNTLLKRNINLCYYIGSCDLNKIENNLGFTLDKALIKTDNSNFSEINAFLSPNLKIPEFIKQLPHISSYTILYDLIPLLLPRYFPAASGWFGDLCNSLNKQDYYFAISRYTKDDFIKYFSDKLDEKKIDMIPLSTNLEYKSNKTPEAFKKVCLKYHIPDNKNYIFSLCSLDPRKNLMRAIKTFIDFIIKNQIEDMVYIVGGADVFKIFEAEIKKYIPEYKKYKDKIIQTGYINDEDLEILYSNAEWFVYTSEYEGFGMPPLEAMKCGCPVITSNNSSLPEVVGNSAITIDFDSESQHIEAYEKYYFNDDLRQEMAQKGIERAKLFSWGNCVDVILNRMHKVEEKKKNKPLVTIITATYNLIKNGRKDYFIQNLESVKNQTYSNIEHIIIDGASDDGTLELLEEYQNKGMIKYYSEPDKGIYDAINKGILKANGKYVVCLNSDDYYCNNKAVESEVMKLEENDADACYGNTIYEHNKKTALFKGSENFNPILNKMPCHQSFLIKTDVMKELGLYDLRYKVSADNVFMFKMIQHNKKFVYADTNCIYFRDGGYSDSNLDVAKMDFINGFWEECGQYHNINKLDTTYFYGRKFLELPINIAIELGCKIYNPNWQKEYFKILFNYYSPNIQANRQLPFVKKIKIFNFLTIFKFKQDFKNKKWYFLGLPIFRVKQYDKYTRKYYIFSIPVLKVIWGA